MMTAAQRAQLDEQLRALKEARELGLLARVRGRVVDVRFEELAPRPEGPRCSHLGAGGRQCESSPADGKQECSRHLRWSHIYPTALPFPEDALSLQEMMGYVVVCVVDKVIDSEQARVISDLCRIMEKNLARCESELEEMAWRRTK
jgi:hypothetical protein